MLRKYMWCVIAILLAVILVHPALLAQVADSTVSDQAGNPLDWTKAELLKWFIPLAGSFLYAQWNKVDGWLSKWNNAAKMALYIAIVTVMMELGEVIHVVVSKSTADWSGTFWEGIVGGVVSTILVKIGITTARAKAPTPTKVPSGLD